MSRKKLITILEAELCPGCAGTKKRPNRKGKIAKCSACIGSGKDLHFWTEEEWEKYRKSFFIATIRRACYRWPPRSLATNDARVGRNQYKCAKCFVPVKNSNKKLDHINPVVDPQSGWSGYQDFAVRALVFPKGWQVLCEVCHNSKSAVETKIRTECRKNKK